ncbi:MAG: GNAT family N-acetyltransferase [Planctomycetes bacterium]|nr:GNAT family N-acetyltransferase [Planctomycetota bacterium]
MKARGLESSTAATRHREREASASRVFLREPRPEDLRAFAELRRASRAFLEPWEPLEEDGTDRFGDVWCAKYLSKPRTERRAAFLVCSSDDETLLGAITLFHVERGAVQSAQIGYWVGVEHARRGVMSRALELALSKAFRGLELQRVEALIAVGNTPSSRLVAGRGFTLEGLARAYAKIGGVRRDHERWSLTREEWLARELAPLTYRPQSRK